MGRSNGCINLFYSSFFKRELVWEMNKLLQALSDMFSGQSKRKKKISNEVLRHPYEQSEKMQEKLEPTTNDENVLCQMYEDFDVNDG